MAFETKKFVLKDKNTPQWFKDQVAKGRAKANYEDGELLNVTIYTPTGMSVAKPGDMIVLLKSGMAVVPQAVVKEYSSSNKKEVKANENE